MQGRIKSQGKGANGRLSASKVQARIQVKWYVLFSVNEWILLFKGYSSLGCWRILLLHSLTLSEEYCNDHPSISQSSQFRLHRCTHEHTYINIHNAQRLQNMMLKWSHMTQTHLADRQISQPSESLGLKLCHKAEIRQLGFWIFS